ncbi:angiotensin-converting enzyme-related protein-like [Anastrepha ludens]|uniref:angiotensin-converting enzyme-related protein-like n=1 Tax=Anastrepha ludens TaxID=28586 RepID=UPI0023AFC294|nr:angiotensin-converting enzyme-related protein-like [Anastrepha ludens]
MANFAFAEAPVGMVATLLTSEGNGGGKGADINTSKLWCIGWRYYVSTILQFQIYRGMCRVSGQYVPGDPRKPLHRCDIYRHPEAGNLLKRIMAKGASQPWQQVLEETLGEGRLDGTALREYFAPLEEWLRLESLRTNEYVGWNYDGDYCKRSIETANLQVTGGFYNGAPRSGATKSTTLLLMGWLVVLMRRRN